MKKIISLLSIALVMIFSTANFVYSDSIWNSSSSSPFGEMSMGAGFSTGKATGRASDLGAGGAGEGPPGEEIAGRSKAPAKTARARVVFMFARSSLLVEDLSWH